MYMYTHMYMYIDVHYVHVQCTCICYTYMYLILVKHMLLVAVEKYTPTHSLQKHVHTHLHAHTTYTHMLTQVQMYMYAHQEPHCKILCTPMHTQHRTISYPSQNKGRVRVHHIEDTVNEFLRALQEVAEVKSRVTVEDLLQLSVGQYTQDLVVSVLQLKC